MKRLVRQTDSGLNGRDLCALGAAFGMSWRSFGCTYSYLQHVCGAWLRLVVLPSMTFTWGYPSNFIVVHGLNSKSKNHSATLGFVVVASSGLLDTDLVLTSVRNLLPPT